VIVGREYFFLGTLQTHSLARYIDDVLVLVHITVYGFYFVKEHNEIF
jgi:hypothetical protein